jgi:F-type H+-transporting ATPase subunit delta
MPRIEEELLAFMCAVVQDERVLLFLDSPVISFGEKRAVLAGALAGFHPVTVNFVLVVVERQRVEMLEAIARAFRDHANRAAGIAEFRVTSARPLELAERQTLEAALRRKMNRPVVLSERVDPRLLGGMTLAHEDFRWDASLAHHLKRLVVQMTAERTGETHWEDTA